MSSPCLGTASRLVASGCELGEGPGWTPATSTLPARVRWLNILAGELHHAAADGSDHVITQLARRTSYAAVTQDGDYLLVGQGMLSRYTPETGAVEDFMPFEADARRPRAAMMRGSIATAVCGCRAWAATPSPALAASIDCIAES